MVKVIIVRKLLRVFALIGWVLIIGFFNLSTAKLDHIDHLLENWRRLILSI
jgi:hypothetical protein